MYFKIELFIIIIYMYIIYNTKILLVMLSFHSPDALEKNHEIEFERNKERFLFLKVCYICDTIIFVFIGCNCSGALRHSVTC